MDDEAFQGRLLPGERIVWSGRPITGLLFTPRDLALAPFSLLWGGFAIFWEWSVTQQQAPSFMTLWGIPFVLIGLYLIAGRFLMDAWLRGSIRYAVTGQRILILRGGPFSKFTALAIDRLPELSLDERADGRGTIRFQSAPSIWGNRGVSSWRPAMDSTPQFLAIADARDVFGRIQKLSTKTA